MSAASSAAVGADLAALRLPAHPRPWGGGACYVGFAACNGDTWASEVGVFSPRPPASILRGGSVEKGRSGACVAWA